MSKKTNKGKYLITNISSEKSNSFIPPKQLNFKLKVAMFLLFQSLSHFHLLHTHLSRPGENKWFRLFSLFGSTRSRSGRKNVRSFNWRRKGKKTSKELCFKRRKKFKNISRCQKTFDNVKKHLKMSKNI
jgi:hypothetical protein